MDLRPFQKQALDKLRSPTHLLCIASTGSGKSLIYERIAAESGRRTLLISPLVALARQQARRLEDAGIPATLTLGRKSQTQPSARVRSLDRQSGIPHRDSHPRSLAPMEARLPCRRRMPLPIRMGRPLPDRIQSGSRTHLVPGNQPKPLAHGNAAHRSTQRA